MAWRCAWSARARRRHLRPQARSLDRCRGQENKPGRGAARGLQCEVAGYNTLRNNSRKKARDQENDRPAEIVTRRNPCRDSKGARDGEARSIFTRRRSRVRRLIRPPMTKGADAAQTRPSQEDARRPRDPVKVNGEYPKTPVCRRFLRLLKASRLAENVQIGCRKHLILLCTQATSLRLHAQRDSVMRLTMRTHKSSPPFLPFGRPCRRRGGPDLTLPKGQRNAAIRGDRRSGTGTQIIRLAKVFTDMHQRFPYESS